MTFIVDAVRTPIGRHGGASRVRKLISLVGRARQMRRVGRSHFDIAVAHGSNELWRIFFSMSTRGMDIRSTFRLSW